MVTSTSIKKLSIVTVGAALVIFGIIGRADSGTAQTITFDNDDQGFKPNGFVSIDSELVSFSDSLTESDLFVDNFGTASIGSQGLAVLNDTDTSSLIIDFPRQPVTSLSFNFGNDERNTALARLDIFNGSSFVDTVLVPTNQNDTIDQSISFDDVPFNKGVFTFADSNGVPINAIEAVDNVSFQAIPEPSSTLGLLTFGAFGAIAVLKRFRGKCQN